MRKLGMSLLAAGLLHSVICVAGPSRSPPVDWAVAATPATPTPATPARATSAPGAAARAPSRLDYLLLASLADSPQLLSMAAYLPSH